MKKIHCRGEQFIVVLALTLSACGNGTSGAPGDPMGGGGGAGGEAAAGFGPAEASELFAPSTLPTFELSLPPERWQYLQEHARDEEYERAELLFEGQVVGQVGLRFKGNIGTLANCFDADDNLVCRKLSMKLKFDEYAPDLRFYGLKRVNLHSMIHDSTLLHEKLTYDLFREVGVTAPRSTWAIARVNGVSLGIFSLVEEVDGRFTKDRWPEEGNGNLYKEAWPVHTEPEAYADAIETNEETATHGALAAFATELQAAPDAAAQREALGRWMDLDHLARYMAVDDAIANIDGATAVYCPAGDPTACGNHNYFFYLSEDETRFQMIPWDLDATLWPRTTYDNVPPWQVTPESCDERYEFSNDDTRLAAPGCEPFFRGLAQDLTDYDAAFESLIEGPFSVATMEATIDRHAAFIADAVAVEPGGQSVERWQSEVALLKENIPRLHTRARARRSGITAGALELSTTAVNDFEGWNDAVLTLLPALSNPSTTTSMSLLREPALEGAQSLLLSFQYRNEGFTPWAHWINMTLTFQGGPIDLTERTGVRLTLRTDTPRTVRLDLEGLLYEAGVEGIKFGWEIPASDAPLTVELPFAEATLPVWARATLDELPKILKRVDGLAFQPMCNGRDGSGLLLDGTSDDGFLELDAIELY